jgi:predicted nucleic acid-binding protein
MGLRLASLAGQRCYVDTNVVIYSVEAFASYLDSTRALFTAAEQGAIELVTSELTLAEALVGPLKRGRVDVVTVYRELLGPPGLIVTISVDRRVWTRSAEIRAAVGGKLPDSVHAATASLARCDLLLTGDRSLRGPPDVPVLHLADLQVP